MKTISDLATWWATNSHTGRTAGDSFRDTVTIIARGLDETEKKAGYTITITPPPPVAAWRLEMQRICRVLLDIDMVDASGLTEHGYAHNAKLRKLWQDKADAHRAAYPTQVQS